MAKGPVPFGRKGFSLRSLVLYIFIFIIFGLLAVFGLFFLPLWKLAEVAFQDEGKIVVMLNPEIIKKSQIYSAKEGCLSLSGQRETKRYRSIKVRYLDMQMKIKIKTFKDFTAQVIQHEIDHCDGILI